MSLKKIFINSSIIFTSITIITNILSLIDGQTTDTHLHLLSRFALCLVGVSSLNLTNVLDNIRLPKVILFIVHYASTIGAVMIVVWLTSFVEPVNPGGYRDAFLNFTAMYIVISIIYEVSNIIKSKKIKKESEV